MFTPLHVKSDFSLGYGTASVDELVVKARDLGYRSLALTDLENLYGQARFHDRCLLAGIRPITGLELRPGFDGRKQVGSRPGRLVLLAADSTGYANLCRIVSRRRGAVPARQGKAPVRDPLPLVLRFSGGLFALSDDPTVIEQLQEGGFAPERLGLLLLRPADPAADQVRRQMADRLEVPLVADLDVIFLQPADHSLHALQLAIRQRRLLSQVAGEDLESEERRLRSPAEAEALFADLPEALTAAREIAAACRLELEVPGEIFSSLSEKTAAARKLYELCREGVEKTGLEGQEWTPAHSCRLKDELNLFQKMGFSDLLLTVAEILAHCRRQGIPAVVRGSAVSSLALYLLGGSPIDPLAQGLLFERFLHPGKTTWPDVDIDLPWHRRDEVIAWVYRHFGPDRVAMVAAHHTFRQRSALREALKAWGARPGLIEIMSDALSPEDREATEVDFPDLRLMDRQIPVEKGLLPPEDTACLKTILALARRLVGRPRRVAAHPGGILVTRRPLYGVLPLEKAPKGVTITQYDMTALDRLGLAKIDLLGNRCLSEIEESLTLAGHSRPIRLESLPKEDSLTLELIDRAETVGCFQLESPAMRSLLARLPIRRQSDVVASLALIRPGAASGEAKSAFIRRARGEGPFENPFPLLEERLRETHGLLLYEEDIMMLLSRSGGLSLGEADELRAAIIASGADPAILSQLREDFLAKAGRRGDPSLAGPAWEAAERFAAYSFNKAHAASYGRLAFLSAYIKAHFPLEFACALLNHHQGLYPLRTLAGEFTRMGVELRGPHVNLSAYDSTLEERSTGERGAVRIGLDKIKFLSLRSAENLLRERIDRGSFASLADLLQRVLLSRREISALVLSGACDGLFPLAFENYPFAHEAVLDLLKQGCAPADLEVLQINPQAGDKDRLVLYRSMVRVRNELRILELPIQDHPLAVLRSEAAAHGCLTIREAAAAMAGTHLRLAAVIAAMRRVKTEQGTMQFLTLEDETGLLEAAVLPPAYRGLGDRVTTPGPFLVEGRLRRQQGAAHLEVTSLIPFHKRKRPYAN